MSVQATTWAWAQPLDAPAIKLTLLCVANRCDWPTAQCWPSQQVIAAETGQSLDTVQRHLRQLEHAGLLFRQRRRRSDGTRTSDMLVLLASPEAEAWAAGHGWEPQAEANGDQGTDSDPDAPEQGMQPAHVAAEAPDSSPDKGAENEDNNPQPSAIKAANCGVDQGRNGPGIKAATVRQQNHQVNQESPPKSPPAPNTPSASPPNWQDDWKRFEELYPWPPNDLPEPARRAFQRLDPDVRRKAIAGIADLRASLSPRNPAPRARQWLRDRAWERVRGASRPTAVFVRSGTPAIEAWLAYDLAHGNLGPLRKHFLVQHKGDDGQHRHGIWRPSLFPPRDAAASGGDARAGPDADAMADVGGGF